jgi:hypothetical protein
MRGCPAGTTACRGRWGCWISCIIVFMALLNKKNEKKFVKFFLLNPQLSFFVYFLFVASYAISPRELIFLYGFLFPWLAIVILFLNMPFFRLLFGGVDMDEDNKINHVLEHGTIYYLKKICGKKKRIGGRALSNGFRVNGVDSVENIKEAFGKLQDKLATGESGIVLSKYCGSNISILQGASIIILTVSFLLMMSIDFSKDVRLIILLINLLSYLILRFPVGKYFQKKLTMSFNFTNAEIVSIEKTKKDKDNIFERSPVFLVRTRIEYING